MSTKEVSYICDIHVLKCQNTLKILKIQTLLLYSKTLAFLADGLQFLISGKMPGKKVKIIKKSNVDLTLISIFVINI